MSNLSFRSHKLSVTALHFIYTHYEFLYAHGRSGPQWAALASVTAWLEAAAHVIFSLQLGLGVLTTYGGYNKFGHSLVRDSCIIIFGHFCWVILSVLLVFSLRGVADSAGILQLPAAAAESVAPNSSAVARAVSVSVLGESGKAGSGPRCSRCCCRCINMLGYVVRVSTSISHLRALLAKFKPLVSLSASILGEVIRYYHVSWFYSPVSVALCLQIQLSYLIFVFFTNLSFLQI